jgi:dihydrolipoamide dehydrogenase
MTQFEYDLVTIGAGGGAYPAAFQLARAGRSALMVDQKGVMSGNCLAEGCVPSKAIREAADIERSALAMPYFEQSVHANYRAVVAWKDSVQLLRYRQHDEELAALDDRLKLVSGVATLIDEHTVAFETEYQTQTVTTENILIASGSDISIPPIKGVEHAITSRDLFAVDPTIQDLPSDLIVIGGGYIGLEVASMMTILGSRVTVLEADSQLLPGMDPDFVQLVVENLDPRIRIELGAQVVEIDQQHRVTYTQAHQQRHVDGEQVLLATGRHPVVPTGASELGLLDDVEHLWVGPGGTTKIDSIWAAGDATGSQMLFHAATRESLAVAHNILAHKIVDRVNPNAVPSTIFTFPEAAFVGTTRADLRAAGVESFEVFAPFSHEARGQLLNDAVGEVRLFGDGHTNRLLGAWVVGREAGQLIGELATAILLGATLADLASVADQHPLAHEAISRAARTVV